MAASARKGAGQEMLSGKQISRSGLSCHGSQRCKGEAIVLVSAHGERANVGEINTGVRKC